MRWTLNCQRPQIGHQSERRPTVSIAEISSVSTGDSFSGNQDTLIYILLETKDPGTTVRGTVKAQLQREQLHRADEAPERKGRREEVKWLVFCVTASWWQTLDRCVGHPRSLAGESWQGCPVMWMLCEEMWFLRNENLPTVLNTVLWWM